MKKSLVILFIALICSCAFMLVACGGNTPIKVEVGEAPDVLTFQQGAELDLTGGTVKVEYKDGTIKEIDMTELEIRGFQPDNIDLQTIVLVYQEGDKVVSTTLDVRVVAAKVSSLELSTEGVKTDYISGSAFDKTNLVVTAHYQTGRSDTVKYYEVSPEVLTADTKAVRITYRGVSQEIPVTVVDKAPQSISITKMPDVTEYFVGQTFDASGLSAKVLYNDGTEETFSSDKLAYSHVDRVGGRSFTDPNEKVIVSAVTAWGTISTELSLRIKAVLPSALTIAQVGELAFTEGDSFSFAEDPDLLSIRVDYNNGSNEVLIGSADYFLCSEEPLVTGQTSISVWLKEHPEKTVSVPITVNAPSVVAIQVLTNPTKDAYFVDEIPDLSGMVLLLRMDNGTQSHVSYPGGPELTVSPSVIGEDTRSITVDYLGYIDTFEITVNVVLPVRLTVIANGDLSFTEGEAFSFKDGTSGTKIRVDYNNGSTETLDGSDEYFSASDDPLRVYETTADVWLTGCPSVTASLAVTVNASPVVGITVLVEPTKTSYVVGEEIELDGLVLLATKENGLTETVVYSSEVAVTADPIVAAETTTVTVTYADCADSFVITVVAAE